MGRLAGRRYQLHLSVFRVEVEDRETPEITNKVFMDIALEGSL